MKNDNYKMTAILFAIAFLLSMIAFLMASNRADKNQQMLEDLGTAVRNAGCVIQQP
jgi:hypothetical protein